MTAGYGRQPDTPLPGQLPMHAPSFTTRVATQVVNHQPADSLALRNWAQIREDPRSRFKESYGPSSRTSAAKVHPQQRGGAANAVANAQVEQLQLELSQARTEIQQLRGALHYAGLALQGVGSWDKLPPELRMHLDQHHRMVDELTASLQERNEEVSKLREEAVQKERLISHHRHVLLDSVCALSGNGPLLMAWSSWQKLMKQKNKESAFKEALAHSKVKMRPVLLKAIKDLVSGADDQLARVIFSKWLACATATLRDAAKKHNEDETISRTMQMWAGHKRSFGLNLTFRAWREVLAEHEKQRTEERHIKEHVEAAKAERLGSIERVAAAFATSSDGANRDTILRLSMRGWKQLTAESNHQKLINQEQQASKDYRDRMVERHCLLMLSNDVKANFAWIFAGWRDFTQHQVIENILKLQTQVFHAWDRVAKQGHRARELAKIQEQLSKEDQDHILAIKQQQTLRNRLVDLGQGSNTLLLLHMVLSAWKEAVSEARRERERTNDREKWREEWEEQKKCIIAEERTRGVALAWAPEQILPIVYSAWTQFVHSQRREKEMEGAQRVFEDNLVKRQREQDEKLDQVRSTLFTMAADSKMSHELLLRCAWSSWRECMFESKLMKQLQVKAPHLVEELKEVIEEEIHPLEAWQHKQGCCHRCCWWCCPRCKPKKIPEHSPYKKPGCMKRCFWCCCPCRKPPEHHGALQEHKDAQHMWDQRASITLGQAGDGIPLHHNIGLVTKEQRHDWRCRAGLLLFLQTLLTLVAIGGNVWAVLLDMDGQGCTGFTLDGVAIPWLAIFIGNIAINSVALLLRFVWLIGGLLMCNIHLVKASEYAQRIKTGGLESEAKKKELEASHHLEVKAGFIKYQRGFRILHVSNCLFALVVIVFVLWSVAGWVMFALSEETCELQEILWPIIGGGMIGWAGLILIVQCCQRPVIGS